jgi:ribonuclease P protein component
VTGVGRIHDRATFAALRRRGRRSRAGPLTLTWLPNDAGEPGPPRLAYAVGRTVGSAVRRNRVRRRLRAVVAESAPRMAPGAYLVAVSDPASATGDIGELREMMGTALEGLRSGATPSPTATGRPSGGGPG